VKGREAIWQGRTRRKLEGVGGTTIPSLPAACMSVTVTILAHALMDERLTSSLRTCQISYRDEFLVVWRPKLALGRRSAACPFGHLSEKLSAETPHTFQLSPRPSLPNGFPSFH
jgi:hypothetical protein